MRALRCPLLFLLLSAGCGTWIGNPTRPGDGGSPGGAPTVDGAEARVQLSNDTPAGANLDGVPRAPTVFAMKVVRVYIVPDIDMTTGQNVGDTAMAYVNPACPDDQKSCDLSGSEQKVDQYLDFMRSSAAVNADFNAQKRKIAPGTYRYARIEFGGANPDKATNLKWAADGVPQREFLFGGTATTVLKEPIVVAEGDTVVFTIGYDLSEVVLTRDQKVADADCIAGADGSFTCLVQPQFTAVAAKSGN